MRKRGEEESPVIGSLHFLDLEVAVDAPRRFRESKRGGKHVASRREAAPLAQDDELSRRECREAAGARFSRSASRRIALHRAMHREPTNQPSVVAVAARRSRALSCASSWSTTRDCAVITAACGRKHVGTRGRGGSSALYVSAGTNARARARARMHACVRSVLRGVRNVPWESIPLRRTRGRDGQGGQREVRGGGRETDGEKERRHKSDLSRGIRRPTTDKSLFPRVFPPTPIPGTKIVVL